ncbi:MAG: efflux RND transporter permease subunit [Desulfomonile tiedjei]|uniref:Efflux RND transporter permease subunit n=1 Tax=Desulfomonile tiedjei TaxID=2358 RepID=A0A9D6YZK9_9BACT|nr:efflux RND transporter permease subunit [Desulfomonile tiedjei]
MQLPHFFIDRPIFATVVSVVIVLLGAVSYFGLPVAQYPEVVPPTIVVRANYPGATPESIAETVATPLEQEINGVEDMLYMESQSTPDGEMRLTVTFKLGTDLDKAQVLVQNRVATAEARLPEDVRRIGVTTTKSSPDLLLVVHFISPDASLDQIYIGNYAYLHVRDVLARLEGVGDILLFGAREYSMRVWLQPDKLAELNLTASDVVRAIRAQNVDIAAGMIGQPPMDPKIAFQTAIKTQGRLEEPDEFAEVVLKSGEGGRLVRVRDVARVELGARDYGVNSYLDGQTAVAMLVFQRPGSNAIATADRILGTMRELSQKFPHGLEYRVVYNPTVFVAQSIKAVYTTLIEASLLVTLVIFVFLQSWRATVIPLAAIPVSLVGTFFVMRLLGFSLNNLSLFGLVLAIGIVVDDAIVVVENVERNIEEGLPPKEATHRAMDEVASALISTALVLVAVFVPTAFLGGISGQFYRQFALTLSVSTAISLVVSLTLSPAMSAMLLRPKVAATGRVQRSYGSLFGWFFRGFNSGFGFSRDLYSRAIGRITRVATVSLLVYGGLILLTYWTLQRVPIGFIPQQDQGYLIVSIQLPDGASLSRTDEVVRKAADLAREVPGITGVVSFAGFSGATRTNSSNAGAIFTRLDDPFVRADKGLSMEVILADLRRKLSEIREAFIVAIPPPPVRGIGTGGGFRMQVQDRSGVGPRALQTAATDIVTAANQQPELVQVFSTFRANAPQLYMDIDRVKAKMLDVPLENVFDTLQIYLGSTYVNDFNLLGRIYRVTAQADTGYRSDARDISRLKTRSTNGSTVPLGSIAEVRDATGPDRVIRYNLYPAADVNGDMRPGFSSGQALDKMERLAGQILPDGLAVEWTDLAFQQKLAGNVAMYIFPLCVLFAFLTLSAQYESWSLPLAVILIVPMSVLCALAGIGLRGMENNVLTQIGFLVLVALACKNAILIVQFAKAEEDKGSDRFAAVVEACRLRLRPILMTAFAFILGVIPLVTARGPGSEMRQVVGTAVFAGMLGVTLFGLFLTPVFYVVLRKLARNSGRISWPHKPGLD